MYLKTGLYTILKDSNKVSYCLRDQTHVSLFLVQSFDHRLSRTACPPLSMQGVLQRPPLSLSLSPPYLSPRTRGFVCTQRQERQQQQQQKQTALYMVPVSISNHGNFTPTLTAWRYLHRGRTVVQTFEISLVAKFCATCAYHIQCSCSPSLRLIFTRGQHSHVKEAVSTRSGYGAMPCCSV